MDNENPLNLACAQIALHADQIWWNDDDFKDSYKTSNLNSYLETVRINEVLNQRSEEEPANFYCDYDAPKESPNWLLSQPWHKSVLCAYPFLFDYVKNPIKPIYDYSDLLDTLKEYKQAPYIDDAQELMLYQKIKCDSVRNIWNKQFTNEKKSKNERNATVPEFYPSVLLPPNQTYPKFPSVFDSDYQSELFPYKDEIWMPNAEEVKYNIEPVYKGIGEEQLNGMRTWLETVYPRRNNEFTNLLYLAHYYDNLVRQLTVKQMPIDESDKNRETKFEELEREAIEQYGASNTSLNSTAVTDLSLEQEVKFQDLEREALEQYLHGEDSETAITGSPIAKDDSCELKVILPESDERSLEDKIEIPSKTVQFLKQITQGRDEEVQLKERSQRGKLRQKKQLKKKKSNKRQQYPPAADNSLEAETRRLANALKLKVLNYLKGIDLKVSDDRKKVKTNVKNPVKPLVEKVKITDIKDAETYRLYVKEVTTNAKFYMETLYKRVRTEMMDTISNGTVVLVSPSCSEKHKVRVIIKRCVNLLNHPYAMKKPMKKLLENARREVQETLRQIHKIMDAVYALRNLSKETMEDVDFLQNGRKLIVDFYRHFVTLDQKTEYIRQKVMRDDRSLLAFLLFRRVSGLLMDKVAQLMAKNDHFYMDYNRLMLENELNLRCAGLDSFSFNPYRNYFLPIYNIKQLQHIHLSYSEKEHNRNKRENGLHYKYWTHYMKIGRQSYHVILNLDTSARQAETAHLINRNSKLTNTLYEEFGVLMLDLKYVEKSGNRMFCTNENVLCKTIKSGLNLKGGTWLRRAKKEASDLTAKSMKRDQPCCIQ